MARNSQKSKYIISIIVYSIVLAISLLICFFTSVQGYVYIIVVMGVSILYCVIFISIYLLEINPNDVEKVKKITVNIGNDTLAEKFKSNGFKQIGENMFYKFFDDRRLKLYSRYIYLVETDSFDIGLEQFLLSLQKIESTDKSAYFEAYIIMLSESTEYLEEIHKENRAIHYVFSDINFAITNKLFKCLIYNDKENTLCYYKINIYPESSNAINFIEKEIAEALGYTIVKK